MQEYLQYVLYIPIETPNIGHSSGPYKTVVGDRRRQAEELMTNKLPDDWEFEFMRKIPED